MTEEPGTELKDYLGAFVAEHVDLSAGRVMLQVSAGEMEALGESLVREVIAWAVESKHAPYSEDVGRDANFLADICIHEHGANGDKEEVIVTFTVGDVFALGQFFVIGVLKWVQGIQIARFRRSQLRNAILAKQAQMATNGELENQDSDGEETSEVLVN